MTTTFPRSRNASPANAVDNPPAPLHRSTVIVFALMHGLACLAPWFFSWSALGVAIFLHWLCGSIGICLAYHRLLSHRGLCVPRWLEYILATIGTLALQGGPIFWVSSHRRHHADTEHETKDPYSASKGFWWSHMLWLFHRNPEFMDSSRYARYAPDIARDPYYRWLDRNPIIPQIILGFVLLALGGWSWVVYGIFVRAVLLWHSTWLINSASHMWGYRTYAANDNARNLWWAAILTYGEGWHNNHHTFPRVAQAGHKWWEIDMTWWSIKVLETLGLATKIVKVSSIKRTQSAPTA
ncbi:MAG: fatty acid desaturase [Cyanobacteria bacterium P01_H01_bin.121]